MVSQNVRKKLIEVALPLDAINVASAREKSIRHGHPSTLHLWWARRPLAAARAVIFAQMVDDPSSHPELFPTEAAQEVERQRLFRIIEQLVLWENTTNEEVLEAARAEIVRSWQGTCEDFRDHPEAATLFDPQKLPAFHDPFAGGGSLPLEAQRLGLEAHASDLNPVAVLINKAMIEIPPKFAGRPPVNPAVRREQNLFTQQYKGAHGLAEDVRYYGKWMRDEAERRIGHLYPKIAVTDEMVKERPDLAPYRGQDLTVIAWLWARTVKSPNPGYQDVDVPLVSTFMLSTKPGKEAYVEPVIEGHNYRFTVKVGKPKDAEGAKNGTKLSRGANFRCIMSNTAIEGDHIKREGVDGRMGARLLAIVAEGVRGRVYLAPTSLHEEIALKEKPEWKPEQSLPDDPRNFWTIHYGLTTFGDLFTSRQLVAMTTFSDLVGESMVHIRTDALAAGLPDDNRPLRDGGTGAQAYAEAVGVYLAFALSKVSDLANTIVTWRTDRESSYHLFSRQAIPMSWDYCELNALLNGTGSYDGAAKWTSESLEFMGAGGGIFSGSVYQKDAAQQDISIRKVVSTDPPYYDNIGYADLSDFFYIWLRRTLKGCYPDLFSTLAVPKVEELVATPYRHGSKEKAETFFLDGMTEAMHRLAEQAHPAFPVTIYYAFKQSETKGEGGTSNTGWETFLDAVIRAGFALTGTWPMRTELGNRMIGKDTNALASSIVLVCRKRAADAPVTDRRAFVAALKAELPAALAHLQAGNIAPVDLAQASIGPGMAVFTRYSRVLDAAGKPLTVRDALIEINRVLDEALAEQEGDFAPDTRWAMKWFEQYGFDEGPFGEAETLATARNTSISGLVQAGILKTGQGKVRLLRPAELPATWDPETDERLSAWEGLHHLIRVLEKDGQTGAATLARKLGDKAEGARELAYRLYVMCERKKRTEEAGAYNALVVSWPEILRLTHAEGRAPARQADLFTEDETD